MINKDDDDLDEAYDVDEDGDKDADVAFSCFRVAGSLNALTSQQEVSETGCVAPSRAIGTAQHFNITMLLLL